MLLFYLSIYLLLLLLSLFLFMRSMTLIEQRTSNSSGILRGNQNIAHYVNLRMMQ